jgi:hypothetical protein
MTKPKPPRRGAWVTRACPRCRKKTLAVRRSWAATTWRRRLKVCGNCGASGGTIEVPLLPGLKAMVLRVRQQGGFQADLFEEK